MAFILNALCCGPRESMLEGQRKSLKLAGMTDVASGPSGAVRIGGQPETPVRELGLPPVHGILPRWDHCPRRSEGFQREGHGVRSEGQPGSPSLCPPRAPCLLVMQEWAQRHFNVGSDWFLMALVGSRIKGTRSYIHR